MSRIYRQKQVFDKHSVNKKKLENSTSDNKEISSFGKLIENAKLALL